MARLALTAPAVPDKNGKPEKREHKSHVSSFTHCHKSIDPVGKSFSKATLGCIRSTKTWLESGIQKALCTPFPGSPWGPADVLWALQQRLFVLCIAQGSGWDRRNSAGYLCVTGRYWVIVTTTSLQCGYQAELKNYGIAGGSNGRDCSKLLLVMKVRFNLATVSI